MKLFESLLTIGEFIKLIGENFADEIHSLIAFHLLIKPPIP